MGSGRAAGAAAGRIGRARRRKPARRLLLAVLLVAGAAGPAAAQPAGTAPRPVAVDVSGANGTGLIDRPGRPCADGGNGAHFHYEYGSALPTGPLGTAPGNVRLHLDLHAEATGAPAPTYASAYLLGDESSASLSNERGTVRLALRSGAGNCAGANLGFDGTRLTAPAAGTWTVAEATGSYRQASAAPGPNVFELTTVEVAPGADNPFRLRLSGALNVLQPALQVAVKDTYWGFLGADYALRRVTVVYEVKNVGAGDAYGVRLTGVTSSTNGVTVLGPAVQRIGDLPAGQSEEVRVKFQFGLKDPCSLVILSCSFHSTLAVSMPDAVDAPNSFSATVQAKAPALPPPVL